MLLDWTGNPLVDVGIAGLCAITQRTSPSLLTLEDLDQAAEEMTRRYFDAYYSSYLSCVFMNSEFVQPAGKEAQAEKKAATREKYVRRVLYAHRYAGDPDAGGLACAFSGGLATHIIHRSQMPMITGDGVFNFFPNLQGGLAIAGPYLTALQTLPLAGRRCEGKLLIVHSDQPTLTLSFASRYWRDNQRYFNLARSNQLPNADDVLERALSAYDKQKGSPKYADAKAPATLLLSDLQDILLTAFPSFTRINASVEALWMSNSGQGPSLRVFGIPSSLVTFLNNAMRGEYRQPWQRLVAKSWESERKKEKDRKPTAEVESSSSGRRSLQQPGTSKNHVLQDLMAVFPEEGSINDDAANAFVSYHLLGSRRKMHSAAGDILRGEDTHRIRTGQIREGAWLIAELFLIEVLGMNSSRLDRIKAFSDLLAVEIAAGNKRLLRRILMARRPEDLHAILAKEQSRVAQGGKLLISWANYIEVFAIDDNLRVGDWRVVRSLISLRVVEKLIDLKAMDADVLPEESEEDESEKESEVA